MSAGRRTWESWTCAVTGALAWAGSAGLASGVLHLGDRVVMRLPWQSPVVAGVALAGWVAVPMTVAARAGFRRSAAADDLIAAAAAALVAWICVQAVVIRTFHPLQVACLLTGLALLIAVRDRRSPATELTLLGRRDPR